MTPLSQSSSSLESAFAILAQRWAATQAVWRDSVSREFSLQYWEPLDRQVYIVAREMDKLGQVMAEVQRNVK